MDKNFRHISGSRSKVTWVRVNGHIAQGQIRIPNKGRWAHNNVNFYLKITSVFQTLSEKYRLYLLLSRIYFSGAIHKLCNAEVGEGESSQVLPYHFLVHPIHGMYY